MDEDREREQSWHVRFSGPEPGEVKEWRRLLGERQSGAHASTPPWQVEVDHGQGSFCLVSLSCGAD